MSKMQQDNFNPDKSRVSATALSDFMRAPITGNLTEVPGIGQASVLILKAHGINTTFQLIAKYLSLKDEGVGPIEHADRFYFWLKSTKITGSFRAGTVHAICEKMNIIYPGIYDENAYNNEMQL